MMILVVIAMWLMLAHRVLMFGSAAPAMDLTVTDDGQWKKVEGTRSPPPPTPIGGLDTKTPPPPHTHTHTHNTYTQVHTTVTHSSGKKDAVYKLMAEYRSI